MKVTKEEASRNRGALVRSAALLFKERGVAAVGVSEICQKAGLTEGALYRHFSSKDELAREAMAYAVRATMSRWREPVEGHPQTINSHISTYLTPGHRDDRAGGCTFAACAAEVRKGATNISTPLAEGIAEFISEIEQTLPLELSRASRRQRATAIASGLVGGLTLARATSETDPRLSREILLTMSRVLGGVGQAVGEGAPSATGTAHRTRRPPAGEDP